MCVPQMEVARKLIVLGRVEWANGCYTWKTESPCVVVEVCSATRDDCPVATSDRGYR